MKNFLKYDQITINFWAHWKNSNLIEQNNNLHDSLKIISRFSSAKIFQTESYWKNNHPLGGNGVPITQTRNDSNWALTTRKTVSGTFYLQTRKTVYAKWSVSAKQILLQINPNNTSVRFPSFPSLLFQSSKKPTDLIYFPERKFNFTIANINLSLVSGGSETLVIAMSHLLSSIETRPSAKAYKITARVESLVIEGASVEYSLIPILTSENVLNGNISL